MDQEEEFLRAFEDHADKLFRHAFFRVSERETARDLVQDTFAKVWEYLAKGNTVEQYRPFLYRTLNNAIIDEYRKHRVESLDALLAEEGVDEGRFEELRISGKEEVEFSFDAQILKTQLERLPDGYRQVLVLRYIDQMLPKEIAALLGENVNAVSVRIHRGMAQLRALLEEQEKQKEPPTRP